MPCISDLIQSNQLSTALLQDDALFQLNFIKAERLQRLRGIFGGRPLSRIYVSNNIRLLTGSYFGVECRSFDPDRLSDRSGNDSEGVAAAFENSLVILNNNDAHHNGSTERLADFLQSCTRTIIATWDWDNHHWLSLSYPLAALSDIYCPAHYDNLFSLTRFNAATAPVPCGVVQWSATFLEARMGDILSAERSDQPLGKHIQYGGFTYRNRVIATLAQRYPYIGFSTHQFHELPPEQKLAEWTRHKLHLIVPVLNDVPIRLFDAWVTGGIPLVPDSLRFSPTLLDADSRDVVFYSAADLIDPADLIDRAISLFDEGGEKGILRRHLYGLVRHHGEHRLRKILEASQQITGFTLHG